MKVIFPEGRRLVWAAIIGGTGLLVLSVASAVYFKSFFVAKEGTIDSLVDLYWSQVFLTTSIALVIVTAISILAFQLVYRIKLDKAGLPHQIFPADAAHELRTPLAVLRVQIESMEDRPTAEILLQDVDRLTHIIEQILDKSRFDALDVLPDEVADLSEVCTSVAAYVAPLVVREGRSIEVIGADQPTMVHGNAFALEQAVKNLISNAVKYSARDTTITVEVTPKPAVHVINRGRGIPKAEREAIFERFHRADRRGGGSGLGLAIVKSVVEAHGGRIRVGDALGGGAIFSITLNAI